MSHTTGLTIRQHNRESVELPVEFVVCDAHAAQVRLSSSSATTLEQSISGIAVDISAGGLGLITEQYVPRMCEGVVRILGPASVQSEDSQRKAVFEHAVKVRRTSMDSHAPSYSIGVSFIQPDPDVGQQIERVVEMHGGWRTTAGEAGDA